MSGSGSRSLTLRLLAVAAASLLSYVTLPAGPSAAAVVEPPSPGQRTGHAQPGVRPPGANDWTCEPTARHPHPVVLVHGTFGDMTVSWNRVSPALVQRGYCVFALDYGNRATGPIEESAGELAGFVDDVLAATGAAKVSMVGHSQGGMMPRYYIRHRGGDSVVEDLVGLAPSNHGTKSPGALATEGPCPACAQQAWGSPFITALNRGDETWAAVDYTQVVTRYDEVVTPYTSGFLTPGPRSTNVVLQESCAIDTAEHLGIIYDRIALRWVVNALGREGPADPRAAIGCV
jgi:triacylglycerol lipase